MIVRRTLVTETYTDTGEPISTVFEPDVEVEVLSHNGPTHAYTAGPLVYGKLKAQTSGTQRRIV